MSFRSLFVSAVAVVTGMVDVEVPGQKLVLSAGSQQAFGAESGAQKHKRPRDALLSGVRSVSDKVADRQPAVGMLKVRVLDEAGSPLPARIHLRDASGRYLLAEGQSTRQRAVYKGTIPVCGEWFYTDGSFSIEVGPGEAQIDIAHGPAYATAHDAIPIVAGQSVEKIYTLRRLIDPLAMGWYSADEHLHQMPDAALMLAEDLNLAALPICGGVELSYLHEEHDMAIPGVTDRIQIRDRRVEVRGGGGCLPIIGVPLLMLGCAPIVLFVWGAFPLSGTSEYVIFGLVSLFFVSFIAVGLVLIFCRYSLDIDAESRTYRKRFSLLMLNKGVAGNLDVFYRVTVSRETRMHGSQRPHGAHATHTVFPIRLVGPTKNLDIWSTCDVDQARAKAQHVAEAIGLPLADRTDLVLAQR